MAGTETNFRNAVNRLIDTLLASMLHATPGASQVDLYGFASSHDKTASGRSRYKLIKSFGRNKIAVSGLPRNRPLADWSDFPVALKTGGPILLAPDDFRPSKMVDWYRSAGMCRIMACPVLSADEDVLGAMFTVWTSPNAVPFGSDLAATIARVMRVAEQVRAVLDLCGHATQTAASPIAATQDTCLV